MRAIKVEARDESGQWYTLAEIAFPNPVDVRHGYRLTVIPSSVAEETEQYEKSETA